MPAIVLSPFAGALVDRWDRRWAMIVSDGGAAAATLVLSLLIWAGRLELWHIYVLMTIISSFSSLSWPAFTAAITMLVPTRHLGRASGMTQMGDAGAQISSPLIAGALVGEHRPPGRRARRLRLLPRGDRRLLIVAIPKPVAATVEKAAAAGSSLWREARLG